MTTDRSDADAPRTATSAGRRLLGVLLTDASAVAALSALAFSRRSAPSGRTFATIAITAAASLAPGVAAVAREEHAHRGPSRPHHRASVSVALFVLGMAVNTAGTVLVLIRAKGARRPRSAMLVDVALLIGGDAIGIPYLRRLGALHA